MIPGSRKAVRAKEEINPMVETAQQNCTMSGFVGIAFTKARPETTKIKGKLRENKQQKEINS